MVNTKNNIFATIYFFAVIIVFAMILAIPASRSVFLEFTGRYAYLSSFIKFALLSTAGEIISVKIKTGKWNFAYKAYIKAVVWGILGMFISLMFVIFNNGVKVAMSSGYLPGGDSVFLIALFSSALMNLTFGVAMMSLHRVTDTIIDSGKIKGTVSSIDWKGFISFVIMKTLPLFWIPAHTITFLLPTEYRAVVAAFLSIVLGFILSLSGRSKKNEEEKVSE